MRSVLPAATEAVGGYHHSSLASSVTASTIVDSFCKDDRRISVGNCALFKPSQDSPPFIGLIRCLTLSEENNLHLGVNWLYRPAELKLGKGSLLDAAPNEIFYSFHKDKIPAASLLHPCKVAFLPRGVELPTGTSSFVCRRVYDIANNCLWWLTDQDYVNERQEEIDKLLYKTRTEMHGTLQPGDRSPKQLNSPSSTAQLKPGCDSGQNSGTSIPSQVKGKKRERGDHGTDPVKRERSSRPDEGESVQCKPGTNLKSEIARIAEKGGVTNLDGVEKLIQLMQSSRMDRNRDMLGRSMLAGVVAATDKADCLDGFVQLRGLPVLDEWLQDIHKGKIGDGYNLKDGDKSVEEFLLVLLRALDKLPVNLHALQMCNIGKSVNHLRTHKNLDIQRKARSLVDTWKKRVEAEMNSIDTKSGSAQTISVWPSKSRFPEASQSATRTPSGSDVAIKSSVTQSSASKTTSARSSHGESNVKSANSSPEPLKSSSSPASGKESQPRVSVGGTPDVPVIREDRSSSSNQSNNCSQSLSGKEDGKSTSAGLTTVSKISGGTARNRKVSGFSTISGNQSGNQKEINFSRVSSAHKSIVSEKSQSASTCERVLEGPIAEGSIQKLIVKIPSRVRSPSHCVNGESLEDPTFLASRASSTMLLDKHEQFDRTSKDKSDVYRSNVASDMNHESLQHSDSKGSLTGSGEVAGSPAALPDEEQSMSTKDSPTDHLKSLKLHESSFSPMNALIESCVKYSAGNSYLSLEDEVGMNLLASVATREMSRSDLVSPTDSPEMSTPAVKDNDIVDEAKSKSSLEKHGSAIQSQLCSDVECDDKNEAALESNILSDDSLHLLKKFSIKFPGDIQCPPSHSEDILAGEGNNNLNSCTDFRKSAHTEWTCEKSNEKTGATSLTPTLSIDKLRDDRCNGEIHEDEVDFNNSGTNNILNPKSEENVATVTGEKVGIGVEEGKLTVDITESKVLCEGGDSKKNLKEGLHVVPDAQEKVSTNIKHEFSERENNVKLIQSPHGQNSVLEGGDKVKSPDRDDAKSCMNELKSPNFDAEVSRNSDIEYHSISGFCSTSNNQKSDKDASVDKSKITEHMPLSEHGCNSSVNHEAQQKADFKGSKSASMQLDAAEKCTSYAVVASTSATREADSNVKIKFDLNKGFSADDGKYGEPNNLVSSLSTAAHMINSIPFSVSCVPSSHPASITVAAAAKGPFVPPEDLMKIKGEIGWKGSAATSAFRPAEPRKSLEMQTGSANVPYTDISTNKHGRVLLDFDLNVPDERVLEELASRDSAMAVNLTTDHASKHGTLLNEGMRSVVLDGSGGLDLDLNRVDEANDNAHCSISSYHKGENFIAHIKPFVGLPTGDIQRDFDLNDGPVVDNTSVDQFSISKKIKGSLSSQLPSAGLGINSPRLGNFSSWFPPGNTYSTVAIPSALPNRVDQTFPVFPPGASQRAFSPIGVPPFTPELYRGSVLSSSPAVPFPSSHFQFPVFPFGTTFPLPSATFAVGANAYADSSSGARLFAPPVNPQFLGVGPVTSQFQRPYVVNLQDNGSNGVLENDRKWGRPGLDLNAGPGIVESEVREESSAQHSVAISQALADEQARMLSVTSGISKRKKPEGGWDNEGVR